MKEVRSLTNRNQLDWTDIVPSNLVGKREKREVNPKLHTLKFLHLPTLPFQPFQQILGLGSKTPSHPGLENKKQGSEIRDLKDFLLNLNRPPNQNDSLSPPLRILVLKLRDFLPGFRRVSRIFPISE